MGRRSGLLALVFFAGCDADVTRVGKQDPPAREPAPEPTEPTEPQLKDPIGPLPQPDPSYRTLDVHLVRTESGAPAQGVEVLSHDASGAMIERLQTDDGGYAPIDVEDGGSVSILWENQFSVEDPVRKVQTFRVTPRLEALNRALQGLLGDPNPPIDVVLDIEPVAGATEYVAQLSCSSQIVSAELPIVFSGYTGCAGHKTFTAIVSVGAAGSVHWAALPNLTLPDSGSVTHTLSPMPPPSETFSITLLGMPAESYAFATFERSADGLHGPWWSASDSWTDGRSIEWTGEVPQLELPVQVSMHTSFRVGRDCSRIVRRDGLVATPPSFSWTPDRLASGAIVDGAIALGFDDGDTPDIAVIGFGGELGGRLRAMSFHFPWAAEEQGPVPNVHVELPADLEDLYGIDGEPGGVGALDMLDALGYEAALASDPRGLAESATSRDCAR